jgi:prepilin-type N-terminal cleavage/methylation domain-containing protein
MTPGFAPDRACLRPSPALLGGSGDSGYNLGLTCVPAPGSCKALATTAVAGRAGYWRLPARAAGTRKSSGFTLLEMIISLTVLSMVVLIIYYAFSMGVSVWNKQSQRKSIAERKEVLLRLIGEDFSKLVPYTINWEKGQTFFFGAGERVVFYVTKNGLGARSRSNYKMFFSCLYIDVAENGLTGIYLFKTPFPKQMLVDEIRKFKSEGEATRDMYRPSQEIRSQSILLYEGIENPRFSYSEQAFEPFSGNTSVFEENSADDQREGLGKQEWVADELPHQVLFQCRIDEEPFFVHTPPQIQATES